MVSSIATTCRDEVHATFHSFLSLWPKTQTFAQQDECCKGFSRHSVNDIVWGDEEEMLLFLLWAL